MLSDVAIDSGQINRSRNITDAHEKHENKWRFNEGKGYEQTPEGNMAAFNAFLCTHESGNATVYWQYIHT